MRSIVGEIEALEHGSHHVLAKLGEPVHQRPRERGQMQALGAPVVRIGTALDHAVRAQPVDQPRQRDRLQVEHFGEFRLLQPLGVLQPRHARPIGRG